MTDSMAVRHSGTREEIIASLQRRLLSDTARLAEAMAALEAHRAVTVPLLGPDDQAYFTAASESLSYRDAKPVIGSGGREVYQDFDLCATFEADSPFWDMAQALEAQVHAAAALMPSSPLSSDFRLNDLIVQRYEVGCRGITPHRDHLRYRELVALVTLQGHARFFVCEDRSGLDSREIDMPPGSLVLLPAPGFAGNDERPFHHLSDVTTRRVSVGLRFDVQPDLGNG